MATLGGSRTEYCSLPSCPSTARSVEQEKTAPLWSLFKTSLPLARSFSSYVRFHE